MPGAPAASGGASATCLAAAGAFHLVPVVLGGLRPRLGQVGDLVGVPDAQVSRAAQVSPAPAAAVREHIGRLVRLIVPRQVSARRPALLTRLAAPAPSRLALRRLLPRQVISARRHRRVPGVPGDQPLQPRDPLLQFRDPRIPVLQQHPQPPVLRAQRGHVIGRIGHTGTRSGRGLRKQQDTPSRPTTLSTTPVMALGRKSECLRRGGLGVR